MLLIFIKTAQYEVVPIIIPSFHMGKLRLSKESHLLKATS